MSRWGIEGPPEEAYSRVTRPERFGPLHLAVLELLQRLEAEFEVERAEEFGLDPELERRSPLSRPSVRLTPLDGSAAPITVVFTSFPGLLLRLGRWYAEAFPTCGCDACDESAEAEIARLRELLADVAAGRLRETLQLPPFGDAKQTWAVSSLRGYSSGGARLGRARARELLAGSRRASVEWSPWPRRSARLDLSA